MPLLALVLAACGPRPQAEVVAEAQRQLAARETAAAVVTLKEALQHDERFAEGRRLLGVALLEGGDAAAAVLELRKAQQMGADPDATLPALVRAMLASGQAAAVLGEFGDTTLTAPRARAELNLLRAQAHAQQNQPERADEALAAALQADPSFAPARLAHARRLLAQGRPDAAGAALRPLLAEQPRLADAWVLEGDVQMAARDRAKAAAAYQRAAELEPAHRLAGGALVGLALEAGDAALAQTRLEALQRARPGDPNTLLMAVRVRLLQGRLDDAREAAQQMLRLRPDDAVALEHAAEVERRMGAVVQAQQLLRKAVAATPRAVGVRLALARLQLASSDPTAALETLAPLLEAADPPAEALAAAAQAHAVLGRGADASALLARAARAAPDEARYRIAQAAAELARAKGTRDRAAALARLQAIAEADASGLAALVLAQALWQQGDGAAALQALQALERRQPQRAELPWWQGRLLEQQGRPADARRAYGRALALDERHPGALLSLGLLDVAAGDAAAAIGRLQPLLDRTPDAPALLRVRAHLLQAAGRPPAEVQEALERAAGAAPTDPAPALALVHFQRARAAPRQVLAAAQRAQAAHPQSLEALEVLGVAQLEAGEVQQALASFGRLVAQRPRRPEPLLRLAEAQRAAGDDAAARRALDQALQIAPDQADARWLQIELALGAGRGAEALELARARQRQQPAGYEGWLWEARVHMARGEAEPAIAPLRQAVAKGAGEEAALMLFRALQPRQADAALQFARGWVERHPRSLDVRSAWAEAERLRGGTAQAEAQFRAALALAPGHAESLAGLARLLAQAGRPGGADLAAQLVKFEPGRVEHLATLAEVLTAERQYGRALDVLRQANERAPDRRDLQRELERVSRLAKAPPASR